MPKMVNTDSTNNRLNPYITKGISKSLLTPCRRVGLSRKKKTPNSALKSSSDVSANDSSSVVLNTTPVTSRQSSSDPLIVSQEAKSSPKQYKNSNKAKSKKPVSKCLIVEGEDDGGVTSSKTSDFSKKSPNNSVKIPVEKSGIKKLIPDDNEDDAGFVGFKREDSNEQASGNTVKKSCNKEKVKKSGSKRVIMDDEDDVDLLSLKRTNSNKAKVKKSVSKRLIISDDEDEEDMNLASLKRNNSTHDIASDPDFDTSSGLCIKPKDKLRQYENKKKKNVLTEIQNDSTESKELKEKPVLKLQMKNENSTKPEKKMKLKRCLSMKKSSEEMKNRSDSEESPTQDCTVFLSPLESKLNTESKLTIDADDVHKLEKEVQEKKKLLEELQRAEINKKLHDVGKLQELTATWKTGCIAALTDLLPHLQRHADIDMATLLSNLRVPEKLVTLSESGDLV